MAWIGENVDGFLMCRAAECVEAYSTSRPLTFVRMPFLLSVSLCFDLSCGPFIICNVILERLGGLVACSVEVLNWIIWNGFSLVGCCLSF